MYFKHDHELKIEYQFHYRNVKYFHCYALNSLQCYEVCQWANDTVSNFSEVFFVVIFIYLFPHIFIYLFTYLFFVIELL